MLIIPKNEVHGEENFGWQLSVSEQPINIGIHGYCLLYPKMKFRVKRTFVGRYPCHLLYIPGRTGA